MQIKTTAPFAQRRMLYERALKAMPGSYKLWNMYLRERRDKIKKKCITDKSYESLNNTYERALVFMHKMPRIWLDYTKCPPQPLPGALNLDSTPPHMKITQSVGVMSGSNPTGATATQSSRFSPPWAPYAPPAASRVLLTQRLVTRTRHVYDRALRSVPITQHDKIWKQYIAFVKQVLLIPSLALSQSILAKQFGETRGVPLPE